MTLCIEVQRVSESSDLPTDAEFSAWANAAAENSEEEFDLVIRIVDEAESAALNERYRGKNGATNVLSFPTEVPDEVNEHALGDLVICAPVVRREASEQGKAENAHWAHMIVHGVLHLRGLDHIDESEAREMESLETAILDTFGIADPYLI